MHVSMPLTTTATTTITRKGLHTNNNDKKLNSKRRNSSISSSSSSGGSSSSSSSSSSGSNSSSGSSGNDDENDSSLNGSNHISITNINSNIASFRNIERDTERDSSIIGHLRNISGKFINHEHSKTIIIILIFANAILLGLSTFDELTNRNTHSILIFDILDTIFLLIFTIEIAMQFIYNGVAESITDPWYVFDFVIIISSWIFQAFSIYFLRSLRIIRAVLLVPKMDMLKNLIHSIHIILPNIYTILALQLLIMYIFAVVFTSLYSEDSKNNVFERNYFGTVFLSLFTCVEFVSLEWAEITRGIVTSNITKLPATTPTTTTTEVTMVTNANANTNMTMNNGYFLDEFTGNDASDIFKNDSIRYAWIPIAIYILIAHYIFFNLLTSVICDSVALSDEDNGKLHGKKMLQKQLKVTTYRLYKLRMKIDAVIKTQQNLKNALSKLDTYVTALVAVSMEKDGSTKSLNPQSRHNRTNSSGNRSLRDEENDEKQQLLQQYIQQQLQQQKEEEQEKQQQQKEQLNTTDTTTSNSSSSSSNPSSPNSKNSPVAATTTTTEQNSTATPAKKTTFTENASKFLSSSRLQQEESVDWSSGELLDNPLVSNRLYTIDDASFSEEDDGDESNNFGKDNEKDDDDDDDEEQELSLFQKKQQTRPQLQPQENKNDPLLNRFSLLNKMRSSTRLLGLRTQEQDEEKHKIEEKDKLVNDNRARIQEEAAEEEKQKRLNLIRFSRLDNNLTTSIRRLNIVEDVEEGKKLGPRLRIHRQEEKSKQRNSVSFLQVDSSSSEEEKVDDSIINSKRSSLISSERSSGRRVQFSKDNNDNNNNSDEYDEDSISSNSIPSSELGIDIEKLLGLDLGNKNDNKTANLRSMFTRQQSTTSATYRQLRRHSSFYYHFSKRKTRYKNFRKHCGTIVNHKYTQGLILFLILINAVILGLSLSSPAGWVHNDALDQLDNTTNVTNYNITDYDSTYNNTKITSQYNDNEEHFENGSSDNMSSSSSISTSGTNDNAVLALFYIDYIILVILTIETCLHFIHLGIKDFFKNGFLVMNLGIVVVSWVTTISIAILRYLVMLRASRIIGVLRVICAFSMILTTRLIRYVQALRDMSAAFVEVIPHLFNIWFFLSIVIYIFAVFFTEFIGDIEFQGEQANTFATLGGSLLTCFEMMTLEWAYIAREAALYKPWAKLPIVIFLFISQFIFFNLMIAIIFDVIKIVNERYHGIESRGVLQRKLLSVQSQINNEIIPQLALIVSTQQQISLQKEYLLFILVQEEDHEKLEQKDNQLQFQQQQQLQQINEHDEQQTEMHQEHEQQQQIIQQGNEKEMGSDEKQVQEQSLGQKVTKDKNKISYLTESKNPYAEMQIKHVVEENEHRDQHQQQRIGQETSKDEKKSVKWENMTILKTKSTGRNVEKRQPIQTSEKSEQRQRLQQRMEQQKKLEEEIKAIQAMLEAAKAAAAAKSAAVVAYSNPSDIAKNNNATSIEKNSDNKGSDNEESNYSRNSNNNIRR